MRRDLVTINQIVVNPDYSYLEMSRFKIERLEKFGLINIYKKDSISFVSIIELENYIKTEKSFFENYISFSDFIDNVFKLKKNTVRKRYKEAILSNSTLNISIKTFNNREYISKSDSNKFLLSYIHKKDVLSELNISENKYHIKLDKLNISEIYLTPHSQFLKTSDFKLLRENISIEDQDDCKWLVAAQVVQDTDYMHVTKKSEVLIKIAKAGHIKYYTNSNKVVLVEEKSLQNYARRVKTLRDDYYKLTQVTRLFDINQFTISQLSKTFIPNLLYICYKNNIDVKYFTLPIDSETIYILRSSLDNFLEEHLSSNQIIKKFGLDYKTLSRLVKKFNLDRFVLHRSLSLFNKKEIELLFKRHPHLLPGNPNHNDNSSLSKFYVLSDVKKLLNISDQQLLFIRREEGLFFDFYKNTTIYLKDEINRLLEIQIKAKKEYRTIDYLFNKLDIKNINYNHFKSYKASTLIRAALNTKNRKNYYLKSELDQYINIQLIRRQVSQIVHKDSINSFLYRLEVEAPNFIQSKSMTNEHWVNYCIDKFKYTDHKQLNTIIPKLINCTKYFHSFLNGNE